jgi:hypothetical protein
MPVHRSTGRRPDPNKAAASLDGRAVVLRPVTQADYEGLRAAELSEALAFRWRLRGHHPSPEQYHISVWSGVLAQFLVVRRNDQVPVGVVTAYQADMVNGHVYLGVARFRPNDNSLSVVSGAVLFVEYLFKGWPFRKLYMEVPDYNLSQIDGMLGKLIEHEGTLRNHLFLDNIFWDVHILSISREAWTRRREALMRFAGAPGAGSSVDS